MHFWSGHVELLGGPTSELLSTAYPLPPGNLTSVMVGVTGPLNLTLVAPDDTLALATGVDASFNSSMIFGKEIPPALLGGRARYTPHGAAQRDLVLRAGGRSNRDVPAAGRRVLEAGRVHAGARHGPQLASLRHVGAAAAAAALRRRRRCRRRRCCRPTASGASRTRRARAARRPARRRGRSATSRASRPSARRRRSWVW